MADFPLVSVFVGMLVLLPLYFANRLYPQIVFMVLSLAMVILSATGFYLTASTGSQPIFAMFLILSLISLPITILHFMLTNAKDWIMSIARGRL